MSIRESKERTFAAFCGSDKPVKVKLRAYNPAVDIDGDVDGAVVLAQAVYRGNIQGEIFKLKYLKAYRRDLSDIKFKFLKRRDLDEPWVEVLTEEDIPQEVIKMLMPKKITAEEMLRSLAEAIAYIAKTYL